MIIAAILGIAAFIFGAMQFLGILTMRRIHKRNRGTDRIKARLDLVRDYFKDPTLNKEDYDPFHSSINERAEEFSQDRKLKAGGLLAMTAAMNIFISFTFPWLIIFGVATLRVSLFEVPWLIIFAASLAFPIGVSTDIFRSYILTKRTEGIWELRVFEDKLDWSGNKVLSTLLGEGEISSWTDHYILLGLEEYGLKIRQKDNSQRIELKTRLKKAGSIELWKKWSSELISKISLEPSKIKELKTTLLQVLSEGELSIELVEKILAITGEKVKPLKKTRNQIRAVYDSQDRKWDFKFQRTSGDVVVIEKTEIEIPSEKNIEWHTAAVESKNLKLLKRFLRDHGFAKGTQTFGYPAFLMTKRQPSS
jgi:hypothetical protein